MTSTALARSAVLPAAPEPFILPDMRVFDRIPEYHHDIVALRGAVVVYETDSICREDFIEEGAFYVVEHQYTPAGMPYEDWLRREMEDAKGRAQPWSRLKTSREIVRLYRWPKGDNLWRFLLPSGMVGKVVGIYQPNCGPLRVSRVWWSP